MARTKVLLKEAVDNLGMAGDVVNVARGYARNYLIPNQLAVWASSSALKQADDIRRAGLAKLARLQKEARAQAEVLSGKRILFEEMAGESGRLYGSVTAMDIEERIKSDFDMDVERRKYLLEGPVRQLGVTPLRIRLMQDVETEILIGVVREGEQWVEAEAYQVALEEALQAESADAAAPAEAPTMESEDEEVMAVLSEMDAAVEQEAGA